jgi:hypothetical protein
VKLLSTAVGWLSVIAVVVSVAAVAALIRDDHGGSTGDGTRLGLSVRLDPGGTSSTALDEVSSSVGEPAVARVFSDTLPPSWQILNAQYPDLPLVVSFKADPEEVVAGKHDRYLRDWFESAPGDRPTWWVYFHEPENNVDAGDFTPSQFSAAWGHVAELAETVDNEQLRATMVLMCWTVNPGSGREVTEYADPMLDIDVLAWDCYNYGARQGKYLPADEILDRAVEASTAAGAGWGVAELGSLLVSGDNGEQRAEWLHEVADYGRSHRADFMTYFHATVGGDFPLDDPESAQAWAEEMADVSY